MGYTSEVIDYYPKRNTMRGMLSSLANHFEHKKFMVFYPHKFSTRLKSFIELCGLEARVITEESTVEAAMESIDYERINGILTAKREESFVLLKAALTGERI